MAGAGQALRSLRVRPPARSNRPGPDRSYLEVHRAISDASLTLDREALLDRVLHGLRTLFRDDFVWIFLVEGGRLRLHRFLPVGSREPERRPPFSRRPIEPGDLRELALDGPGLVAHAARSGASVRVDDVRAEPRYLPFTQGERIRSELAVPIQSAEEVLGAVNLESTRPARYTTQDEVGLAYVCRHLGTALANLRHRVRERQTLLDTITALSSLVDEPGRALRAIRAFTRLKDAVAGRAGEVYAARRAEEVEEEQRRIIRELSTPVIEVWEGILVMPIVGIIDSGRAKQMMEQLLNRIVELGSRIVILDVTGVPSIDTGVADHLLRTTRAARLVGARSILVGISPQVAVTLVRLGVSFGDLETVGDLRSGLALALELLGHRVVGPGS
ncbi:hypothetical protein LIP_1906 [Limnochorda pilosa]|uniref:STAS domain-containing protein n=1 Tax=Limnochorda pilosa TaxID=1555112 RepID=A0A0K2SL74_LIMPI|nr:hypothetical protein LIP_1906 [Limnochorda pilosa]